ncbi:MAG TPA: thrombospondin type 3 repeat-containing protein [Patescibacteria group bacterium]|nr:thrombospondin type 3 repeat-containing protein [Patescibacteria group bacterium]
MVIKKFIRSTSLIILLASLLAGNFFISVKQINSGSQTPQQLADYLTYFYDRYSRHFDANGLIFQTPDYEVKEFSTPKSAREILSLALYYKYRALAGEVAAQDKIRAAILAAEEEISSRPFMTQSFSDAFAAMAEVQLLDQFPTLLEPAVRDKILHNILSRAEQGIKAPDTSNRAALSAVYWQIVLNNFLTKQLITEPEYERLSALTLTKIKEFAEADITADGWYLEGTPKKFNPHYHLITAFSFLVYGELTDNLEFILLAEQLTANLRLISFKNGMVEARIGDRPVGLGAQFYLGAGLLNYYFHYPDWNVYLNYASGNRFFSDKAYPDRLEYHSTIAGSAPRYHDDISFSNLSELALAVPTFDNFILNNSVQSLSLINPPLSTTYQVTNTGTTITFNNLLLRQTKDGGYTTWQYLLPKNYSHDRDLSDSDSDGLDNHEESLRGTDKNLADTDADGYSDLAEVQAGYDPLSPLNEKISKPEFIYGKTRLSSLEIEQREAQILKSELTKKLGNTKVNSIKSSWSALINAYVYGRYTVAEIADTILHGPRAVHPTIPASTWRGSANYKKYLNSK